MRKALLATTVAIATMTSAVSAADFGLDIKGGLNISNIRGKGKEGTDNSPRFGMTAGLGAQIGITDMFAIQPEVIFNMKGYKYSYNYYFLKKDDNTLKLSYLNIPLLFKVKFPAEKVITNVYAGPDLGIKLSSKEEIKSEAYGVTVDTTIDYDISKSIDFGIAIGGGIDIKAGPGRVILDLRYTLGLSSISDYDEIKKQAEENDGIAFKEEKYEAKNGVYSIMVGYGIDF